MASVGMLAETKTARLATRGFARSPTVKPGVEEQAEAAMARPSAYGICLLVGRPRNGIAPHGAHKA